MMQVVMRDIHHGKDSRSHIIYASLYEADTNYLYISATLEYCLGAIKERNLILVKDLRK